MLDEIDNHAVPLIASLEKIQLARAEANEAAKIREEAERYAQAEASRAEEHRRNSASAFRRLSESPRDGHWAQKWNTFVAAHAGDEAFKDHLKASPEGFAKYNAVMDSEAVPAKRKAIREFLEFADKL
jgi:hypothetical protein